MAIKPYALTNVARVKARLEIASAVTTWDSLLAELINGATGIIEQYLGNRRLASATYTNQIYTLFPSQKIVFLKAWPVTALSSVQYRAGTPDVPSWTDLLASEYELDEDGSMGILRLYTALNGPNALRVTYTAGYSVDLNSTYTLPESIIEICERLVVRLFKKRTDEGKASDSAAEASVTWITDNMTVGTGLLGASDKSTLDQFMRPHFA